MQETIHVSVVSHGQGALVRRVLADLAADVERTPVHVTLTLNVPERLPFDPAEFPFPVVVLENQRPAGFAANHNAAFEAHAARCGCDAFCVVNPDARVGPDVLFRLAARLEGQTGVGVVAPLVQDADGRLQDSARKLPTPATIAAKALGWRARPGGSAAHDGQPDWVAGMFMLFARVAFAAVGGFDERYFLYYEDVDICCRLRLAGYDVVLDRTLRITHDGAWKSHHDLQHLRWHLASMLRFFASATYLRSLRRALVRNAPRAAMRAER
jgi:GT2 family glycosyltransferase